jgi:type II secretory pathway component PulJ
MDNDKIYIDYEDLFNIVKDRVDIASRGATDLEVDRIQLSNSYKETLRDFFNEGVTELQNDVLTFERLKNYNGTLRYEVTDEQQEAHFKKAKNLIEKTLIQYILYAWYDSVGSGELARRSELKFEKYKKDLISAAASKKIFSRPYSPYW